MPRERSESWLPGRYGPAPVSPGRAASCARCGGALERWDHAGADAADPHFALRLEQFGLHAAGRALIAGESGESADRAALEAAQWWFPWGGLRSPGG